MSNCHIVIRKDESRQAEEAFLVLPRNEFLKVSENSAGAVDKEAERNIMVKKTTISSEAVENIDTPSNLAIGDIFRDRVKKEVTDQGNQTNNDTSMTKEGSKVMVEGEKQVEDFDESVLSKQKETEETGLARLTLGVN